MRLTILVKHPHPGHVGRGCESLEKLASPAGESRACRTHEYTLSNLKFARAVEPGNLQLINCSKRCEEMPAQGRPALPSSIELEMQVTPFLRTPLRQWKNGFR